MAPDEISVRVTSQAEGVVHLVVTVRPGTGVTGGGRPGSPSAETVHEVTLAQSLLDRLAPNELPESFIRRCFLFLLEREPNDAILQRFDAAVIGRYFPEFERVLTKR